MAGWSDQLKAWGAATWNGAKSIYKDITFSSDQLQITTGSGVQTPIFITTGQSGDQNAGYGSTSPTDVNTKKINDDNIMGFNKTSFFWIIAGSALVASVVFGGVKFDKFLKGK